MPNILTIDGGGIRGGIPCATLEYIKARTQTPIGDVFDLIVGTSTGGILALGLAKPDPKSAAQAKAIYTERGADIFHASWVHKVLALGNLIGSKYPATGIKRVLGEVFGEARMHAAKPAVMVSSFDLDAREPVFFKSWTGDNVLMRDCARATSAALTYFPPARVGRAHRKDAHTFVDGGLMALNPSVNGLVTACHLFDAKPEDCLVLSLGTGITDDAIVVKHAKRWGLIRWALPLVNFIYDASMSLGDARMRTLLPQNNYLRVQTSLRSTTLNAMDDASAQNVAMLNQVGQDTLQAIKPQLDAFCDRLVRQPRAEMSAAYAHGTCA